MKLKLPQQLLLALLAAFVTTPCYAANIALTQTDATAKKKYESGTAKDLQLNVLGQTNFTLGENVTFTGYNYNYEHAQLKDNFTGGTKDSFPCYGNVFQYSWLDQIPDVNTLKGDAARSYSLSFVNNTSTYSIPRALDGLAQSYGGAAYFTRMIFSDLNKLSFSGNKLVNTLGGTAGKNQPGIAYGGALFGNQLWFTQMNEISFTNNTVESNYWAAGGALYAGKSGLFTGSDQSFMSHIKSVVFDGNKALASSSSAIMYGGALSTQEGSSQHLFADLGTISFTNNMIGYSAVVANTGTATMDFQGGAVYLTNFLMQRVEKLIFQNNSIDTSGQNFAVRAWGGALRAATVQLHDVLALDTNTGGLSMLFEENKAIVNHTGTNTSQAFGGAVHSRVLNIINSGHVLFKNNYSSTCGGAVYLARNEVSLTASSSIIRAQQGDITFVGNTHKLADSNERNSGIANSIYLAGGYDNLTGTAPNKQQNLTLAASTGRTIYLYDAIDSAEIQAANLRLHFGGSAFDGSVVFSGEKVVETLAGSEGSADYAARVEASKTSAINAEMVLWNGSLILKSGVTLGKLRGNGGTGSVFYHLGTGVIDISDSTLTAEIFDATYNKDADDKIIGGGELARWKVGTGAKLIANTIDFSDGMGFDVSHYITSTGFQDLGGLVITANSTTFGGKLLIADNADYYTDNIWSKKGVFTLLDTTNAGTTGDFTDISSKLTGSNLVEDPYQYKGEWTYAWVDSKLLATWTPLGGIEDVNPELEGNLIPNSMWSTASNVRSLSKTALDNANIIRLESKLRSSFWVKGIGDFAYDDSSAQLDGYSYQGGGYAAGADFLVAKKSIVGVAFGQLIGTNKSELYSANIKQDSMMASLYAARLQEFHKNSPKHKILWTCAASYGTTDNSMNTRYSDGQSSAGSWNNEAFLLEAKATWRISPEGKNWTYMPVIGVEYTDVTMDSFTETGDKARHFGKGKYANLALPIGMGVEHQSHLGKKTWLNSLSLAYVPDVYRDAPHTQATRLSNDFSWKDQGSKPSIHTFRATVNSTLQLNAAWTAYAGYTFEARASSSYHNVNTGVSYSF